MGIARRRGASWRVLQLDGDEGTETNLFSDSVKLNFDSERLQTEVSPPQEMKLELLLPGQKEPLCS